MSAAEPGVDLGKILAAITIDDSGEKFRRALDSIMARGKAAAERDHAALIALIDARIELALVDQRRKSLDLYRKGRDGIPEPAGVPSGDVDGVVDGAGGGLVGSESGDQVGEVTHGLAPSSVAGASAARTSVSRPGAGSASRPGDDTAGGAA